MLQIFIVPGPGAECVVTTLWPELYNVQRYCRVARGPTRSAINVPEIGSDRLFGVPAMNSQHQESDRYASSLKPKWRARFDFYDAFGAPNSAEARAAIRMIQGRRKRARIEINWFGFLFGPVYFLVLGMWRRALTLGGMIVVAGLFLLLTDVVIENAHVDLTKWLAMLAPLGFGWLGVVGFIVLSPAFEDVRRLIDVFPFVLSMGSIMTSMTVNHSYYLTFFKGDNGWNPYKGMSGGWWWGLFSTFMIIGFGIMQLILTAKQFLLLTLGVVLAATPVLIWRQWKRGAIFPRQRIDK
ncbi:MAG: DUF2628 domain-containing protein [Phycisphaerales bacterium]|nr:DUF2628 domain-containing protein [Phycisphaerales bacterium]